MQLSFVFSIHCAHQQYPKYQRLFSSRIDEISGHSSELSGTGGLESLLFLGCFAVWFDIKCVNDLESFQLPYIHLILVSFFVKLIVAS